MSLDFIIPVSFFFLVGWIIKTVSDNRTKRIAIQSGNLTEYMKSVWEKAYANKPIQNFKWATILITVGVIILLSDILVLTETIVVGLLFISIGVVLLYFYKKVNN